MNSLFIHLHSIYMKESNCSMTIYNVYASLLGELIEVDRAKRDETTKELDILKKKRATKYAELTKLFQQMQDREKEIGYVIFMTTFNRSLVTTAAFTLKLKDETHPL